MAPRAWELDLKLLNCWQRTLDALKRLELKSSFTSAYKHQYSFYRQQEQEYFNQSLPPTSDLTTFCLHGHNLQRAERRVCVRKIRSQRQQSPLRSLDSTLELCRWWFCPTPELLGWFFFPHMTPEWCRTIGTGYGMSAVHQSRTQT